MFLLSEPQAQVLLPKIVEAWKEHLDKLERTSGIVRCESVQIDSNMHVVYIWSAARCTLPFGWRIEKTVKAF